MKKIFAILVLAILVFSMLPAVIAHSSVQIMPAKALATDVEDVEETVDESEEETEEDVEDETEVLPLRARLANARQIAADKMEQARQRYQEARQRYTRAKERYQEVKLNLGEAKGILARCGEDETEECITAGRQVRIHARDFLLNTADRVLDVLEKLKAKTEANEDLSEEQAAEILADLDARIEEIEDAKAVIENLGNESTKQEIKEAAQTIKQAWSKTRLVMKRSAGRLVNAKIGGIIVKSDHLET